MIIPTAKIYEACSKDSDRPILRQVHYNAAQKRLEACDGFILAIVPVPNPNGTPDANIPMEAVKEAQKLAKKRKGLLPSVTVDGEAKTVTVSSVPEQPDSYYPTSEKGATYDLYTEGHYPDCQQIVPRADTVKYVGSFDAEILYRLAKAICESGFMGVNLYQKPGDGSTPFVVEPITQESRYRDADAGPDMTKAIGVLMPVYRFR